MSKSTAKTKNLPEIEPRHNSHLAAFSLFFSIFIAPLGAILAIISLVRIAKNKIDETIDAKDEIAKKLSVFALTIGIILTCVLGGLAATGNSPWQIAERNAAPAKIEASIDKELSPVISMSEEKRQQIAAEIDNVFTASNMKTDEMNFSGTDFINWILEDISYEIVDGPNINDDISSATCTITLHHHNVSAFGDLYSKAMIKATQNNKAVPNMAQTGEFIKTAMKEAGFVDENIGISLTNEYGEWVVTQESIQTLANTIFNTQATTDTLEEITEETTE